MQEQAGGSSADMNRDDRHDQGFGPGGQYSLIHWKISLCQ